MKMRVTPRASRHLERIATYIALRDASASIRVGIRIQDTFNLIREFPLLGRKGTLVGTKELLVSRLPFVVVYRIEKKNAGMIAILGIYHCAQERPRS